MQVTLGYAPLTKGQAVEKMKGFFPSLVKDYEKEFSSSHSKWDGDICLFSLTARGHDIKGTLTVLADALQFEADLPFPVNFAEGKIREVLTSKVYEQLGIAPPTVATEGGGGTLAYIAGSEKGAPGYVYGWGFVLGGVMALLHGNFLLIFVGLIFLCTSWGIYSMREEGYEPAFSPLTVKVFTCATAFAIVAGDRAYAAGCSWQSILLQAFIGFVVGLVLLGLYAAANEPAKAEEPSKTP